MAVILKYAASVYQTKIETFNSLDEQLDTHLENLENLRDQVSGFWQGDQTASFLNSVAKTIAKVRKASADIKEMSRVYQEIINEQTRVGTAVDDVVNAVDKATDKAINAAGAAAAIIPLL